MKRDLALLADREFDLIVIGGGIFGACAARDAAQRGLSVALVEKCDFLSATSSNHFRMIHGGIRYLQHGDIYRIRESSRERRSLLRVAPHLVYPLPIVIPTYGHGMQGKEVLRIGTLLYDVITVDRNFGISDQARRIPTSSLLSRAEVMRLFPGVETNNLTGAVIFHDGQTYHPARLGISFIKSAVESGAQVANYTSVIGFLRKEKQVIGVRVEDVLTGERLSICGKMVLNATGPWANTLLHSVLGKGVSPPPTFSRDVCLIVNRKPETNYALAVQGSSSDPDAFLSRGHRHLFVVPWQDSTLVGVWHTVHKSNPDDFSVTEEEILSYIDDINNAYPGFILDRKEIVRWMAGLVLFGENADGSEDLRYGHRSLVIDHSIEDGIDGLVTLIGVRYTTALGIAKGVIDMVGEKLRRNLPASISDNMPIHGGKFIGFNELLDNAIKQKPPILPDYVMEDLIYNHGSAYQEVIKYVRQEPIMGEMLGKSKVIKAEILNAVRDEMAQKLSDVVFGRTNLGSGLVPDECALNECATIMAGELKWDGLRVREEIQDVKRKFLLQ